MINLDEIISCGGLEWRREMSRMHTRERECVCDKSQVRDRSRTFRLGRQPIMMPSLLRRFTNENYRLLLHSLSRSLSLCSPCYHFVHVVSLIMSFKFVFFELHSFFFQLSARTSSRYRQRAVCQR